MNSHVKTLELEHISKSFNGKKANDDISLTIEAGEIIGLLGENGAGKTTLMNILYGLYQADEGTIRLNGKPCRFKSPRDALNQGIGMVHQHFMLVPHHSVLQNLVVSTLGLPFFFPEKAIRVRLENLSSDFNLGVDPRERAFNLSAGELQRVEITKALLNGAEVLILDEPTSVLGPQEAEALFAELKHMAAQGKIIIIISHKLEEILSLCHRVLILRKGRLEGDFPAREADKKELARRMVGREINFSASRSSLEPGETILEVQNLRVLGDRGNVVLEDLSFSVRKYEIFGIAGVSGNGQRELAEALTGLRKVEAGKVLLDGEDVSNADVKSLSAKGLGHIPEERMRFGIVPNLLLYENAVLKDYHTEEFSDELFLKKNAIKSFTEMIVENFRVSSPSIHTPIKNLSGGNIQKLILGREISGDPTLLIASHPTYGLDVGATEYIHEHLLERRNNGGAILLLSEDLEEVLKLSDRLAVMYEGRFMGLLAREEVDLEALGLMMAGVNPATEKSRNDSQEGQNQ